MESHQCSCFRGKFKLSPPKVQPPIGTCGAGLLLGASLSVLKLRGELMWIRTGHWVLSLISATGQHFPLVRTIHERCATNAQRKLTQALIAWQGPTCTQKSAVMSLFTGWQSDHCAYSCRSGSWALMLSSRCISVSCFNIMWRFLSQKAHSRHALYKSQIFVRSEKAHQVDASPPFAICISCS